ncbi:hypothetical protein [Micromonospora sp. S-DT3-3-22]|uniref:hypothetical protein n=1 Tax=Micromonospora sp. S-DT3-3-22 TaxID=2755359 RepID=UPI0018902766|nr:hypothetical protein [Micromonospora sp. S-DT3-3-22]
MSGRRKLLLVAVAVLLVAAFVGALGLGRAGRGDPADPGALGWLGRLGGDGTAVDPATVRVDCDRTGDVLSFVGGCTLRVDDPGGLRTLVLRSRAAFAVTAPAPGDADLTVRDDVTPGDGGDAVATIAVDRATEVGLGCPGGVPCTVTIATS